VAQGDVADHTPASKPNEREYMDLALIKKKPRMPVLTKSNWLVTVDEQTRLTTTKFFESKNSIAEPVCVLFDQWRQAGKAVSFAHCNAGEKKKTQERASSEAWKPGLEFKYTARATPQQNHLAELAFATLGVRGRALTIEANIYSHGFGHACANHTQQQNSILVQPLEGAKNHGTPSSFAPGAKLVQSSSRTKPQVSSKSVEWSVCLLDTPKTIRVMCTICGTQRRA
jgi:hypothetical protein